MRRHFKRFHLPREEVVAVRFPCGHCPKDFSRKSDAKRHVKRFHSVTEPSGEALLVDQPILISKPSGDPLPVDDPIKVEITNPSGQILPSDIKQEIPVTKPSGDAVEKPNFIYNLMMAELAKFRPKGRIMPDGRIMPFGYVSKEEQAEQASKKEGVKRSKKDDEDWEVVEQEILLRHKPTGSLHFFSE